MEKIKNFIILTLLFMIFVIDMSAKDVSGRLSAGEGSSFVPSQGSAFSIISDLKSGIYGGKFNILIKSGGRIIYNEKNQVDDLYLVFNEPVDSGDIIKLDVIKGVFIFKMSHMDTLPDVIVDAIKEQAPAEYRQLKPLHNRKKRKPLKKKPIKRKPLKEKVSKKPIKKITPAKAVQTPVIAEEPRVIKRHIEPSVYKQEIEKQTKKELSTPPSEILKESQLGERVSPASISKPTSEKSDLGRLSSSIDTLDKEATTLNRSKSREIESSVIKSDIESVAKESKVTTPKTSTSSIDSIPLAKTFPVDRLPTAPTGMKVTAPDSQNKIESFKRVAPPSVASAKTESFRTQINRQNVVSPSFKTSEPDLVVKKIKIDKKIEKPVIKESIKHQPIDIPESKIKSETLKYVEPEVDLPQPEVIMPEPVDKPQPRIVKKTDVKKYVKKSEPKDKIVITKTILKPKKKKVIDDEPRVIKRHIEPKEYKEQKIQERMSDRVIGGGYGIATPGRIKVKAYSNNRPVSAWVEVFRADTKKRVKTFYTGKGRSLKDVKLPAGVYVIKATYRTAGSKRKKTIGKITLQEGESINKKITFDDGSIKVKVTKNGKPIYAKVEVYKSGKKRRVAYEFTSRSSGVANLSLGGGKYDIVVRDHAKTKRFDSIRVRGGKSRTLNVDF